MGRGPIKLWASINSDESLCCASGKQIDREKKRNETRKRGEEPEEETRKEETAATERKLEGEELHQRVRCEEMWRRRLGALLLRSPPSSSSTAASSCQHRRRHLLPSEVPSFLFLLRFYPHLPPRAHSVQHLVRSPPLRLWSSDLSAAGTSCCQSSCTALHVPSCKSVFPLKHMHCCFLRQHNRLLLACE